MDLLASYGIACSNSIASRVWYLSSRTVRPRRVSICEGQRSARPLRPEDHPPSNKRARGGGITAGSTERHRRRGPAAAERENVAGADAGPAETAHLRAGDCGAAHPRISVPEISPSRRYLRRISVCRISVPEISPSYLRLPHLRPADARSPHPRPCWRAACWRYGTREADRALPRWREAGALSRDISVVSPSAASQSRRCAVSASPARRRADALPRWRIAEPGPAPLPETRCPVGVRPCWRAAFAGLG